MALPMRPMHHAGHAWNFEPVAIQELIDIERKWSAASGCAHELDHQLIGHSLVPVSPRQANLKGGSPTRVLPMGAPERLLALLRRSRGTPLATALPRPPLIRRRSYPAPGRSSALPRASACAHRVQFFQRDFARFSKVAPASPERFRASFWPHERRPRKPLPKLDQRYSIPGGGHVESSSLAWTRASCLSTIKTTLSLTHYKHG